MDPAPPSRAKPDDVAMTMYTSGSTGKPKGVAIRHAAFRNFVEFWPPRWGCQPGNAVVLQQSSLAFDMAISQVLVCLGWGGTLVVPDNDRRRDPAAICDLIASEGVTFTIATPTEYLGWIRHGGSRVGGSSQLSNSAAWQCAVSAGEPVTMPLVQAFRSLGLPNLRLLDGYGPTEATFGCADRRVPLDTAVMDDTTGTGFTPFPNYAIRIVDEDANPVPVGVPGRVAIAGAGVAVGYLNPEQIKLKGGLPAFLPDQHPSPFFEKHAWVRLHLTEDRGVLNGQGDLVLLGRVQKSTMVKMGGIRIDLRDIEEAIIKTAAPHVRQVVVTRRVDISSDIPFLVAFVVLYTATTNHDRVFLNQLPQRLPLPRYMRPSMVVAIDSLPVTPSGKVDRSAVDVLSLPAGAMKQQLPELTSQSGSDELSSLLWRLWQEVLPQGIGTTRHDPHSAGNRVEIGASIDTNVDFFEMGGNSLCLIRLQAIIKERFGVSLSIAQLFGASRLGSMAALLKQQQRRAQEHDRESSTRSGSARSPAAPDVIDWEQEASIPPDLAPTVMTGTREQDNPHPPTLTFPNLAPLPPGQVILTGATGFLGREILRQLIADPRTTRIHCLAVRRPREQLTPAHLFAHAKVAVYAGDLGAPRLGLSAGDAAAVFAEADAVVHCGADVSLLKSYRSLWGANVGSVRELSRLVLSAARPNAYPTIHFVSTAAVVRLAVGVKEFGPASIAPYPPSLLAKTRVAGAAAGGDGGNDREEGRREGAVAVEEAEAEDGYLATKWVGEVFLERVSRRYGLPVVIHRPSSVMGRGEDGLEPLGLDVMANVIEYALRTGTVPEAGGWDGYLDFVSVETTAGTIVEHVMASHDSASANSPVKYVYEAGEVVMSVHELRATMEARAGGPLRVLPVPEWVDVMEEAGLNPLLVAYLRRSLEGPFSFPRLLSG
jgi:hybrid polyketide synthase/nonribosomal peptide synthetase ACE1